MQILFLLCSRHRRRRRAMAYSYRRPTSTAELAVSTRRPGLAKL